jgi:hypothetical protein
MHKDIIYISDYFIEQLHGGAEISDNVIIEHLSSIARTLKKVKSCEFTPSKHSAQTYIISNFTQLSEINKKWFINLNIKYILIERDQKYVRTRNTAMYNNFIAPKSQVINEEFYKKAHKVFCLTKHSAGLLLKHISLNNVVSLGCTQFSEKQLNILESNLNNKKNNKFAIIPGKRSDLAIRYCQENNLNFKIIEKTNYKNFIKNLSKYKGVVFFSHAVETCCRLLVEARVLNLKILTDNKNGCTYEDWFNNYKGKELLSYLKKEMPNNLKKIEKEL